MIKSYKKDETLKLFMQKSAWSETGEGWKREPMNGFTVELVERPGSKSYKSYQPIINRHVFPRYDFDCRQCQTLEEAKEYTWRCIRPLLDTPRDDGPLANMEMCPT
jgi:hypothetical protein